jgi:hypothetical protein
MSNGASEEYLLTTGEGLIDVRGDGFDCGLVVDGGPVAFCWSDCAGSIAQYLVRSKDTRDLSTRLATLRAVAGGALDPAAPLAPQIAPLLALFGNGRYRLTFTPSARGWGVIPYSSQHSYAHDRDHFYPSDYDLIMTQPTDTLNRERIAFFRKQIAAGGRPIVFPATVEGAYGAFVIDGHHKLQAYQSRQTAPAVLLIEKLHPASVNIEEGTRLLGAAQRYRSDYRSVKRGSGGIVTEADWADCTAAPWLMVDYLQHRAGAPPGDRKWRLFAAACCRLRWDGMDDRCRAAVEVAERHADGEATAAELAAALRDVAPGNRGKGVGHRRLAARACRSPLEYAQPSSAKERRQHVLLLRDVFGNPFRPVRSDRAWLAWNNGTVGALAEKIYAERAFELLPVLADALEEAGCTDPEILGHLRGPGPHVRGCWAVDLLLGKV